MPRTPHGESGKAVVGEKMLWSLFGQVDVGDRPSELARKRAPRALLVATVAWLGVSRAHQGQKLGNLLLAQALRDCHEARLPSLR